MDLYLKYISNTHHTDVQHIHTNRYTYNTRKKDSGIYIYILETTMMRVIILLICMNAFLMASIDASSIRGSAKGPGAEILSTIHTLEKTEAIMKKTQAAMQAKIDKLNANMAVGMDKHIDGTVNKIVNAYHLKENQKLGHSI